jgi:hypothetical protein
MANNIPAMERAINGYSLKLGEINETMDLPDVDEGQYYSFGPWLERHRNQFAYMVNNTTCTPEARNCWNNAFQYNMRFENGRPFTYYDGTLYFIPPGQMKDAGNGSFVPPGAQNGGSSSPAGNGYMAMSGGQQGPYDHNYSYNYSYDYDRNNSTDNYYNYSYNETNLSPGPHQESHGKN